jgi:hypothetical protein
MFTYLSIYTGVDSSYDLDADGFVGQEDYRLAKHIDNTKKGIVIFIFVCTYLYMSSKYLYAYT